MKKTDTCTVELTMNPSESEKKAIDEGLDRHNSRVIGEYTLKSHTLLLKNSEGDVVAGVGIDLYWDWMVIADLWFRDDVHAANILLSQIEELGRKENIHNAETNTVFPKYCELLEKNGYMRFGVPREESQAIHQIILSEELSGRIETDFPVGRLHSYPLSTGGGSLPVSREAE